MSSPPRARVRMYRQGFGDCFLVSLPRAHGSNYHVLIDISGFRRLLDAVGGINLDVGRRVPIGGVGGPIVRYITPGKNKHLTGYEAMPLERLTMPDIPSPHSPLLLEAVVPSVARITLAIQDIASV